MNKTDVIDFFNDMAPSWDAKTIRRENAISAILDMGEIKSGKTVLDIGCGTGVLFPDYLSRGVSYVLGVDISPEMIKIANNNFNDDRADFLCADAETMELSKKFDCIMIHNAFPHFMHPEALLRNLSSFLAPNGRITVAHSMSRAEINKCHEGKPSHISTKLPKETELAGLLQKFFEVDTVVSDEEKYIVSGILNITE